MSPDFNNDFTLVSALPITAMVLMAGLLVTGLVVCKGRPGRRLIGIVAVVVSSLVVMSLLFLMSTRRHLVECSQAGLPVVSRQVKSPAIWAEGLEEQFGSVVEPNEKLWVADFAEFVNLNPRGHWLVGRSQKPCVSEQAAAEQAMADACSQVQRRLAEMPRQFRRRGRLRAVTQGELREGGFIVDRFSQGLEGTSGKIWRQAVLLDVTPKKLGRLAERQWGLWRADRAGWLRRIGSIAAILALVCVVYLFLNLATKGYYTWSLRVAAVVLLAGGAALVLMWA